MVKDDRIGPQIGPRPKELERRETYDNSVFEFVDLLAARSKACEERYRALAKHDDCECNCHAEARLHEARMKRLLTRRGSRSLPALAQSSTPPTAPEPDPS